MKNSDDAQHNIREGHSQAGQARSGLSLNLKIMLRGRRSHLSTVLQGSPHANHQELRFSLGA